MNKIRIIVNKTSKSIMLHMKSTGPPPEQSPDPFSKSEIQIAPSRYLSF